MKKLVLKYLIVSFLLPLVLAGCKIVSVASDGTKADGPSYFPSISGPGRYVAFHSDATNLVAGDINGQRDIFVHDFHTASTRLVSKATDGTLGNADSYYASISDDGRYVVFVSEATNLVPSDTNGRLDTFIHDLQTGTTTRVSVASDGSEAAFGGRAASISGNGEYVVFDSRSGDIVTGDTNDNYDVFIYEVATGLVERVTLASDGSPAGGGNPSVSHDGRYVAFSSTHAVLHGGTTPAHGNLFVHDRVTQQTTRITFAHDGGDPDLAISGPARISADGQRVAFSAHATNLVPGDNNGVEDVFFHDMTAGTTSRVSVYSDGQESTCKSYFHDISANGRHVAFLSCAIFELPPHASQQYFAYIHDTITGKTEMVSLTVLNTPMPANFSYPSLTADGRYMALGTRSFIAEWGNTTSLDRAVVRATQPIEIDSVSPDHLPIGATTAATITGSGFQAGYTYLLASGIEASNLVVVDENTFTVNLTVDSDQTAGAVNLMLARMGDLNPGLAVRAECTDCITYF